jgi:hypothetical protein
LLCHQFKIFEKKHSSQTSRQIVQPLENGCYIWDECMRVIHEHGSISMSVNVVESLLFGAVLIMEGFASSAEIPKRGPNRWQNIAFLSDMVLSFCPNMMSLGPVLSRWTVNISHHRIGNHMGLKSGPERN